MKEGLTGGVSCIWIYCEALLQEVDEEVGCTLVFTIIMETESDLDASVIRLILRETFLYQLDLVSPYPAREERPVLRSRVPVQVELSQEAPEAPHVYLARGMRRRFLLSQEDLRCTIVPRLDVHGLDIEVLIRHKDRRAHVTQFDLHRFDIFNQDIFWLHITVHYAVPLEEG